VCKLPRERKNKKKKTILSLFSYSDKQVKRERKNVNYSLFEVVT